MPNKVASSNPHFVFATTRVYPTQNLLPDQNYSLVGRTALENVGLALDGLLLTPPPPRQYVSDLGQKAQQDRLVKDPLCVSQHAAVTLPRPCDKLNMAHWTAELTETPLEWR